MPIRNFDPDTVHIYSTLTPLEKVMIDAQEGFCDAHGFIYPISYSEARKHVSGDSLLDHIVIELCEGCEGLDNDPEVAGTAINKLEVSVELLQAAINGIRKNCI